MVRAPVVHLAAHARFAAGATATEVRWVEVVAREQPVLLAAEVLGRPGWKMASGRGGTRLSHRVEEENREWRR